MVRDESRQTVYRSYRGLSDQTPLDHDTSNSETDAEKIHPEIPHSGISNSASESIELITTERLGMTRVLIIGMDGATFDIIRPLVDAGKLPHLKGIIDKSVCSPMASTVPPMTFPAWNTFMTGKNPGKHGIYDFTERKLGTLDIQLVNSRNRRAKTIWKILSDAGLRVGVVGVPVCYPPEPINGVMISGFDAPVTEADEKVVYPPELCAELNKAIGGYIISADMVPLITKGKIEEAMAAMEPVIERKAATAKYLLQREPWDCFMVMFGETDACVHYFWKYHDPASPHYDPERCRGVRDPILAVYQKVDAMIGEILALVDDDTAVMLVSDHGTGGASDKVIHLNRWLEEQGFFSYLTTSHSSVQARLTEFAYGKVLPGVKNWVRAIVPRWVLNKLRFGNKSLAYKLESSMRFASIDWTRTQAFSEEPPYYPQLWINLKGRDPHGIVEPGEQYEEVRNNIIEKLYEWRNPETGEQVVKRVYRGDELYEGEQAHKAPDLLISWNLTKEYAYLFRSSQASKTKQSIETVKPKELWGSKFMINRSGCHRDDGIFALKAAGIQNPAWIDGVHISDIAPTLLYLFGLPIPSDMDGMVPGQVFSAEHLNANPIQRAGGTGLGGDAADGDEGYSAEDEEAIKERLQGLGYIE